MDFSIHFDRQAPPAFGESGTTIFRDTLGLIHEPIGPLEKTFFRKTTYTGSGPAVLPHKSLMLVFAIGSGQLNQDDYKNSSVLVGMTKLSLRDPDDGRVSWGSFACHAVEAVMKPPRDVVGCLRQIRSMIRRIDDREHVDTTPLPRAYGETSCYTLARMPATNEEDQASYVFREVSVRAPTGPSGLSVPRPARAVGSTKVLRPVKVTKSESPK